MSQIEELQQRITAALDRIGQGLELAASGAGGADPAEMDALREALDEEKLANQQLEERVRTLREREETQRVAAELAQADLQAAQAKFDKDLQALRKANQQLRDNNQALRQANEAGVAEPHLINKAMLAELEGLRASRAADQAETSAVMAELERLIAAAGTAAQDTQEEA